MISLVGLKMISELLMIHPVIGRTKQWLLVIREYMMGQAGLHMGKGRKQLTA